MEVPGTAGYEGVVPRFVALSEAIDFRQIHGCPLPLLPEAPARVLDAGAGSGRDAAALAALGHDVVAVEPMPDFLAAARARHASPRIRWVADILPHLRALADETESFHFVLCHAVWQHLSPDERGETMTRFAGLLAPGGVLALGLRHGPPGAGTHSFPASLEEAEGFAGRAGLDVVLHLPDQPSHVANKSHVRWTRLAFARA